MVASMLRVTMFVYVVGIVCGLAGLYSGSGVGVVEAACANRVRKSYDSLTAAERRTYIRALQTSMDRGYYIKFVEMHTERMSEMEAHRVCMFTYWHRYFLIGFENMLRSLGPEFECVTIPYWDEMAGNARAMAGSCANLEACSPIVRELGGSSSGQVKGLSINGAWVSGDRCVNAPPLGNFCETSSKRGTACARCLPRANLQTRRFPSATNFASVYRQLFTSGAFVTTGRRVEDGMHNAIHAELGAAMGTFQSPADPLFWSHHAYVDLLLTIYYKCRVGLGKLTDAQKMNNQYAFVSCPHREDAGYFNSSSTITMRTGELGRNPTPVNQRTGQVLYPFFQSVPNLYYKLSDVTQLGANRYSFQVGGLVGQMASQCDAATGRVRRLTKTEPESNATRPVGCLSDIGDEEQQLDDSPPTKGVDPGIAYNVQETSSVDSNKVLDWVDDARSQLTGSSLLNTANQVSKKALDDKQVAEQLEKMVCMFYDSCRGGVQDYSEQFKRAFRVTEPPPCKRIVDELKSKSGSIDPILLPKWKQTMEKYFPCNVATSAYSQ